MADLDQLAAARRAVVRHFHRYSPEQRATHAASHRLGHRQRHAVGEHFYTPPRPAGPGVPDPDRSRPSPASA